VDPRKSPTSEAADIRIWPRPGGDVALCYGIAAQLIRKKGVDLEFINRWTCGYEAYLDEALKWTPKRVEQVTGVSEKSIDNICNRLIAGRPSIFMIGLGLQKSNQGAEAARAVALLPALLGYHRGFHYSDANGRFIDWSYISGDSLSKNKGKVVNQVSIGDRLEAGEFKFVFILGTNPAITLPNQSAVRRGTYLEKTDINFSDHHLYSRLSNKAIEPLGESKSEIWVMQQLAEMIGLKQDWLFEDPWKALQEAFSDTYKKGDLQDILEGAVLELKLRPYNEYQTPSGKIEFVASKASDIGALPLPSQNMEEVDREWFILLNSSLPKYTHSQFTDVYGPIPQIVWINPNDAKKLDIRDGEIVEIFNELGTVTLNVEITDKVSIGMLWAPRPLIGLNGVPLNSLVPGTPQEIGGGPAFNSVKVKIKR
jgi:anaerobic selenocysteine-containing dehydrogenase